MIVNWHWTLKGVQEQGKEKLDPSQIARLANERVTNGYQSVIPYPKNIVGHWYPLSKGMPHSNVLEVLLISFPSYMTIKFFLFEHINMKKIFLIKRQSKHLLFSISPSGCSTGILYKGVVYISSHLNFIKGQKISNYYRLFVVIPRSWPLHTDTNISLVHWIQFRHKSLSPKTPPLWQHFRETFCFQEVTNFVYIWFTRSLLKKKKNSLTAVLWVAN